MTVGSQVSLEVKTTEPEFCGVSPSVTWHLTNPEVVRVTAGMDALMTAIAPGHTQISATVRYEGRTSEAMLFWCQRPPGSAPFPASECTWIPMSGVRVVP